MLAVIGYNLIKTDAGLDAVIGHLYNKILGEYWDKERRYVDENYTTIPFPFEEISAPPFVNSFEWNFEQLIGFLQTWSALQHYKKEHQQDPVILVLDDLKKYWGNAPTRIIEFPIMLRIGQL